jgi:secondary thiamine-phosphate synthase enzyme
MVITYQQELQTQGCFDIIPLTNEVKKFLSQTEIQNGIALVHCTATTATILITEYESGAMEDLREKFEEFAPRQGAYKHHQRGVDDNGRAHVLSAFLNQNVSVPIIDHQLALGTWQEIVLIDLDTHPRTRTWILQIVGL